MTKKKKIKVNSGLHKKGLKSLVKNNAKSKLLDSGVLKKTCIINKNYSSIIESAHNEIKSVGEEIDNRIRYHEEHTPVQEKVVNEVVQENDNDNEVLSESANRNPTPQHERNDNKGEYSDQNLLEFEKEKVSQRFESLATNREMSKSPVLRRSNQSLIQNDSNIMNENEMSIVNKIDNTTRTTEKIPVNCLVNKLCDSQDQKIKDIKQTIQKIDNVAFDNSKDFSANLSDQENQKSIKGDNSKKGNKSTYEVKDQIFNIEKQEYNVTAERKNVSICNLTPNMEESILNDSMNSKETCIPNLSGISEDSNAGFSTELSSLNDEIVTNTKQCEINSDVFDASVKKNEIIVNSDTIEVSETNKILTNSELSKGILVAVEANETNSENVTISVQFKVNSDAVETSKTIKENITISELCEENSDDVETSEAIKENITNSEQCKVNLNTVEPSEAKKENETIFEQFDVNSDTEVIGISNKIVANFENCKVNSGTVDVSETNDTVTNSEKCEVNSDDVETSEAIKENITNSEQSMVNLNTVETSEAKKENETNSEQFDVNSDTVEVIGISNKIVANFENCEVNSGTVNVSETIDTVTNSKQCKVKSVVGKTSEAIKVNVTNSEQCKKSYTTEISEANNDPVNNYEQCKLNLGAVEASETNKVFITNSEQYVVNSNIIEVSKTDYDDVNISENCKVKSDAVEIREKTNEIVVNSDAVEVSETDFDTVTNSEQCVVNSDTVETNKANNEIAFNSEQREVNSVAIVSEKNYSNVTSEQCKLKNYAVEKSEIDNEILTNSEQCAVNSKERELFCQSNYKEEFSGSYTKSDTSNHLIERTNDLSQSHGVKEIISEKYGDNITEDICTSSVKGVPNRIIDISNVGKVKGTNRRKLSIPKKHLLVQNLSYAQPMRQLAIPKDKINRNRMENIESMNISNDCINNLMLNDINSCSNSLSLKETIKKDTFKESTFRTPISKQLESINTLEKIKNVSSNVINQLNKELYHYVEPGKIVGQETNLEEINAHKEVSEKSNEDVRIQSIQEKIRSRSFVEYKTLKKEIKSPLKCDESVRVEKEDQELFIDNLKSKKLPPLRSIYAPPSMTEINQRLVGNELEPKCKKLKTPCLDIIDEQEKNSDSLNTIKIKQEIEEPPIKRRRLPPLRSIYDNKNEIANKALQIENSEKRAKIDNKGLYEKEPKVDIDRLNINLLNNEEGETECIDIKMEPIDLEIESTEISDTLTDRFKNVQQDLDFKLDDFRYRVDCIMEEKERLQCKFDHVKMFLKSDVSDPINTCSKSKTRNLRQSTVVNSSQSKSLKCHMELKMSTQNEWKVRNDDDEEIAWQVEDVQRIVEKIQIAKEKIHRQMLALQGHMVDGSDNTEEQDLTNDNTKNPKSKNIMEALQKIAKVRSQIQSYFTLDTTQNNFPETEVSNTSFDSSQPIEDVILKELQKVRKLVALQDGVLHRANENILRSKERLRCQMSMMVGKLELLKTDESDKEGTILRNLLHTANKNRKNTSVDANFSELETQDIGCKEVSSPPLKKKNMTHLQSIYRLENMRPNSIQKLSEIPCQISDLEEEKSLGNQNPNSQDEYTGPSSQKPYSITNSRRESHSSVDCDSSKQGQDLNIRILSVESLNQNQVLNKNNRTVSENSYNPDIPIKEEKNSTPEKDYDKFSSTTILPSPENCFVSEKVLKKCPVCKAKLEFILNIDKQMLTTQCICNLHILVLLDPDEDKDQKPTSFKAEGRRMTRRSTVESSVKSLSNKPLLKEEVRSKDTLGSDVYGQQISIKQEMKTKALKRNLSKYPAKRSSSLEGTEKPIFVSSRSSRTRSKTSLK